MDIDTPSITPDQYLDQQEAKAGDGLRGFWGALRGAYERKLWHNVTVLLTEYVAQPEASPGLIELFEVFVKPIESKINPLKLVEIGRRVAVEYTDPQASLTHLLSLHSRLASPFPPPADSPTHLAWKRPAHPAPSAFALSLSSIAYARLRLGELEEAKKVLKECEVVIELLEGGEGEKEVMGGFYGVSAEYYKIKADYTPFYTSSLLFLACIDITRDLSAEQRVEKARDLGVAALLGEGVWNFGELLQHPLLSSLDNTPYEWIKQALYVFNAGDIGKWESGLSAKVVEEPILAQDFPFLRQKLILLALMDAVFRRPRAERAMSFETVARETKLPVGEVEFSLMKALSLKLIKGTIDQVAQVAHIHWVQPRVLDGAQSAALGARLEQWCGKVGEVGGRVQGWRNSSGVAAVVV